MQEISKSESEKSTEVSLRHSTPAEKLVDDYLTGFYALGKKDQSIVGAEQLMRSIKYLRRVSEKALHYSLRHIERARDLKNGDVFIVTYARRAGGTAKQVVWFERLVTSETNDGYEYLFRRMTKSLNRAKGRIPITNIVHMERLARLGPLDASSHEIGVDPSRRYKDQSSWKSQALYKLVDV